MLGVHVSCPDVAVRLSFSLGSLYRPNTSRIRAVLASAGSGVRGGSRGSAVSALGGLGARGGRPGSLTALPRGLALFYSNERANSKQVTAAMHILYARRSTNLPISYSRRPGGGSRRVPRAATEGRREATSARTEEPRAHPRAVPNPEHGSTHGPRHWAWAPNDAIPFIRNVQIRLSVAAKAAR